jgi:hypothetical protein
VLSLPDVTTSALTPTLSGWPPAQRLRVAPSPRGAQRSAVAVALAGAVIRGALAPKLGMPVALGVMLTLGVAAAAIRSRNTGSSHDAQSRSSP